ncbi:exopolysaccharide biosynthesis protein [Pseudomonas sp. gcc21]|uniref:exopolysaccharide biosynthesis protein n=1 Tax=Pseudomonas sp. gcc21 TaxID=2726989 RepID=UPI0014526A8D|nr:exopolysaccharide biosynthesis protein [Pseudomonas sp. gcc21]QJD58304.1 exopolysaccharide biosynthesis protein [Pseudomonas sp. gcc21]
MASDLTTMQELLDRIVQAEDKSEGQRTSLGSILETIGPRAFGPLLLLAGLITLVPVIGGIPGVPTVMGVMVVLTAGQLLFGREQFWLPKILLNRSISRDKLDKAVKRTRPAARFVDRVFKPRLEVLVKGPGLYMIAIACVLISLALPAMELVPFSALSAGAALAIFGIALIARDGLLALIAMIVTLVTLGLVTSYFFS